MLTSVYFMRLYNLYYTCSAAIAMSESSTDPLNEMKNVTAT